MDEMNLFSDLIYFSGELVNNDRTPVPDGKYSMTLSIFLEPSGGKEIWSQWVESVLVYKGKFRIPVEKKSLPFEELQKVDAYLELQTGKEPAPSRQKLNIHGFPDHIILRNDMPVFGTDNAFFTEGLLPEVRLPIQERLETPRSESSLQIGTDTEVPVGIDISDGYVYVSTSLQNFHVIDARDPSRPAIVGSVHLDLPRGAAGYHVIKSGAYAFVLCNNNLGGGNPSVLLVLDVSTSTQPFVLSNWSIDAMIHRLAVSTEHAVVSLLTGILHFFLLEKGVYPVHASEFTIGRGFADTALRGTYVYVVGTSGYLQSDFLVIDLGNIKQPTIIGSLPLPAHASLIRVAGHYAYVAGVRNVGHTIDISNPAQPVVVGSWDVIVSVPGSMWIEENRLYISDQESDIFQILDISNPLQPTIYDFTLPPSGGGRAYGAVSNGFAYIISTAPAYLQIIRLPHIGT